MDIFNVEKMEKKLGYSFKDKSLLIRALTRKDAVEKNQVAHDFGHQGILATLGDAILKAILVHQLIESGCDTAKKITDEKKEIENRDILASISQELMIGNFMLMSNGEKIQHANEMPTPLAETLEAVIGAIYLDAGYDTSMKVIKKWKGLERFIA
jgi:ribonuclease-3